MNFPELDVAIGLSLVYLVLSMLCSTVQEAISSYGSWRANTLHEGISTLLQKQHFTDARGTPMKLVDAVYAHPLINGLAPGASKPSYIPSRTFTQALLAVLHGAAGTDGTPGTIARAIAALPPGDVRSSLLALGQEAGDDGAALRASIERWFDDAMERVSGWYKRHAQMILRIIALLVAVLMNVDTISLVTVLRQSSALRENAVAAAQQVVSDRSTYVSLQADTARKKKAEQALDRLDLPLGLPPPWWNHATRLMNRPAAERTAEQVWNVVWAALSTLVGWLITAAALSLGAPFWFDALNKLINLRAAGPRPPREDAMPTVVAPSATPPIAAVIDAGGAPAAVGGGASNEFEAAELSTDDVRDIQRRLGILDHVAPGVLDAPTRAAIESAQRNLGLESTGRLSPAVVERILYGDHDAKSA
jgi:hypothetical protein